MTNKLNTCVRAIINVLVLHLMQLLLSLGEEGPLSKALFAEVEAVTRGQQRDEYARDGDSWRPILAMMTDMARLL